MKYVLVSGGMYCIATNFKGERTCIDGVAGVISGIGKGVIGMPLLHTNSGECGVRALDWGHGLMHGIH
jgi:hypothetical protein